MCRSARCRSAAAAVVAAVAALVAALWAPWMARSAPPLLLVAPSGQGAAVLLAGVGTAATTTPGGRRNVGRLFAEQLAQMGASVAVVARSEAAAEELRAAGFAVAGVGDLMDPAFASKVVMATKPATIFTAVGGKDSSGGRVDGIANINLFKAAAALKPSPHIVFVTSWGCGETYEFLNEQTKNILGPALKAKTEAEEFLRGSGLNHMIVRPGGLVSGDEPATRKGILIRDRPDIGGSIRRQDLAGMLLWLPRRPDTNGLALTALDRDMLRAEPPLKDEEVVELSAPGD